MPKTAQMPVNTHQLNKQKGWLYFYSVMMLQLFIILMAYIFG